MFGGSGIVLITGSKTLKCPITVVTTLIHIIGFHVTFNETWLAKARSWVKPSFWGQPWPSSRLPVAVSCSSERSSTQVAKIFLPEMYNWSNWWEWSKFCSKGSLPASPESLEGFVPNKNRCVAPDLLYISKGVSLQCLFVPTSHFIVQYCYGSVLVFDKT